MRILLLRLLICSWGIPVTWIVLLPMFYLMGGNWEMQVDACWELTKDLWTGNA